MAFKFNGRTKVCVGILCLLILSAAFTACGSAGSGGNADKGKTTATTMQEIKVAMGDFFFDPGNITVKAGKVRFLLSNVGNTTDHRFIITGEDMRVGTRNVGVGKKDILEVDLKPGTYKLGCSLDDHEAKGSMGKLTVLP